MAIGPEQGTFAVPTDQTAADQVKKDLTGLGGKARKNGIFSFFSEQVFKTATVVLPLGLGFKQWIGAELSRCPQKLTSLLGDGWILNTKGRI